MVECVWLEDWVCMMDKVGMEWKKTKVAWRVPVDSRELSVSVRVSPGFYGNLMW